MSSQISTFLGMTEDQVKTYITVLISGHRLATQRHRALNFVESIYELDKATHLENSKILKTVRLEIEKQISSLSVGQPSIFSFSDTVSTILQALASNDHSGETFHVENLDFNADIVIKGSNITLLGSYTGSAKSKNLACSCTVNGNLKIEGSNILIQGIKFNSNKQYTVEFPSASSNVVLRNCSFKGLSTDADSRFWFGTNYSGDCLISGCEIADHKSWFLADISSNSSVPTVKLGTVSLSDNWFSNNMGSLACRGKVDESNDKFEFVRNLVETTARHEYFWSAVEANNTKVVIANDNEFKFGNAVVGKTQGAFQFWNRVEEFDVSMLANSFEGFNFVFQIPINSSGNFKVPTFTAVFMPDHITNCTNLGSHNYPWDDNTGLGTVTPPTFNNSTTLGVVPLQTFVPTS